jgi:hypothetical protein
LLQKVYAVQQTSARVSVLPADLRDCQRSSGSNKSELY